MKILTYIIVIFGLSSKLTAQYNYVPNYSFEQYDSCPSSLREIDPLCKKWFTPMSIMDTIPTIFGNYGSSDYFNFCGIYPVSCPKNVWGYQFPNNGDAYAGIALLSVFNPPNHPYTNYKEYIEVKLKKKLNKGKEYCFELYYSISDKNFFNQTAGFYYRDIEIEALLTAKPFKREYDSILWLKDINANAQISNKLPIVIDTSSWMKTSGSFTSNGNEQYLTIGNFRNTDNLHMVNVYLYIDDVKLYYCGPDTTPHPTDSMIIPNIFTPNGDGFNDKFEYKYQKQWEFETQIFNRWGNLVFDNNVSRNWNGTYQGKRVSNGVYFYIIKAQAIKTGEIRIYKGTVTVMY